MTHERFQTHCRFCTQAFEGDSADESIRKVTEHEREKHSEWMNRVPVTMEDFFPNA